MAGPERRKKKPLAKRPRSPRNSKPPNGNSARKLLDLLEQERRLLAYEIHDGVVQDLVGAKMLAESLQERSPACQRELDEICRLLGSAVNEARRLIRELRPLVIDEMGIVSAISFLVSEARLAGHLRINFTHRVKFDRLAPLMEGALFRITQEALTNARRHAQTNDVKIRLKQTGNQVVLEVEDRGVGFDPRKVPDDRYGLSGIKERARLLGGVGTIESTPGKGTRVRVELPIELPPDVDDQRW